ncbi:MAG: YIP1 family protein, partial [Pseudomonadota bacterium]
MPVTTDITATYRGPGRVVARLLALGQREDRALAFLMGGCLLVFVAQLPRLAREAHLTGQALDMLLGASLMAWVIIAPLIFYLLAALSHLVARAVGGKGTWFGARLALFWALLASSPVL